MLYGDQTDSSQQLMGIQRFHPYFSTKQQNLIQAKSKADAYPMHQIFVAVLKQTAQPYFVNVMIYWLIYICSLSMN